MVMKNIKLKHDVMGQMCVIYYSKSPPSKYVYEHSVRVNNEATTQSEYQKISRFESSSDCSRYWLWPLCQGAWLWLYTWSHNQCIVFITWQYMSDKIAYFFSVLLTCPSAGHNMNKQCCSNTSCTIFEHVSILVNQQLNNQVEINSSTGNTGGLFSCVKCGLCPPPVDTKTLCFTFKWHVTERGDKGDDGAELRVVTVV